MNKGPMKGGPKGPMPAGKGPMPGGRKIDFGMLKRVLKMLFEFYPVLVPVAIVCILISAAASALPPIFMQKVIAAIETWQKSGDWVGASKEIVPKVLTLGCMYCFSIVAVVLHTQLMAIITQGFLSKMRCRMFDGMQNLPIKYFDTNKHGDIMSHYTNDIDTLRQLISQSIPSVLQSCAIIACVMGIMLYFSVWMTLVLLIGVVAMILVSGKIGGGSAKYFIRQQKAMGRTEGYVQEMMNGQKVVKVFCHEEQSKADFDKINDALYEDSFRAHAYANMLGPIIANIGNVLYALVALVGGIFLLTGAKNLSISGMAFSISIVIPFLNMTKQFTGNVNGLSQQINSIVMGLAGAGRILGLMDEQPETDDGYVTLVNAKVAEDGTISETAERTGIWA